MSFWCFFLHDHAMKKVTKIQMSEEDSANTIQSWNGDSSQKH